MTLGKLFVAITVMFGIQLAIAHEGRHHGEHHQPPPPPTDAQKVLLEQINASYLKDVKPAFQRTCFDCHSSNPKLPWYQKIPGIRQWMQSDLDEAKEHLQMDSDFPFQSHATITEDLQAIDKEVQENEMPPFRYRLIHPNMGLTAEEKKKIHSWAEQSLQLLH